MVIDGLTELVASNLNQRQKKTEGALKLLMNVISAKNDDEIMKEGVEFLLKNL